MLQQTINNIESAQMDVQVMEALKEGDKVISELQSKASLEDFEELYDRHQEQKSKMEMEQEFFGQIFNDEELEDELATLDAELVDMQIPSPMQDIIHQEKASSSYNRVEEQQSSQTTLNESPQKRELVAA